MAIDYKNELNSGQLAVVEQGDGPCLVLAGAGTGKTRTIVYRVAYLIENGVDPNSILLVTFTNKASKEMLHRVELLLGRYPAGLWGGTFHHIGNTILRKYGREIGIEPTFTIIDQVDSRGLVKSIMTEAGITKEKKDSFPKAELIHSLISYSTNSMQSITEIVKEWIPKQMGRIDDIIRIASIYEHKKRQANLVDFDDLLVLWLKILRECPEVRQELSRKFEYILVDEYQDTNKIQGMIVECLAKEHKNILVVGDDAQSIYAFRAATVENIMGLPEIFPNTKVFKLKQNYRSTQSILNLANASIAYNRRQFEKELLAIKEQGNKPELVGCSDTQDEAKFVGQRIVEIQEEKKTLKNTAVLFRAAFHAMQLELELQKRHIPYIIRGGIRFFEQAHVKDLTAYLKIISNPLDDIAWQRVLQLEPGIGIKNAEAIARGIIRGSLLGLSDKALGAKLTIDERVEKIKKLGDTSKMIMTLLSDFYQAYAEGSFENSGERIEDLQQLSIFAEGYESLSDFLIDATLSEGFKGERVSSKEKKREDDYLVLSTIHQAKGLEWENVFVLGLIDGQFPHHKSFSDKAELEEERRLFYVAITRAKNGLVLSYPLSQYGAHGASIRQPSLFMRELNTSLYQSAFEDESDRIIEV